MAQQIAQLIGKAVRVFSPEGDGARTVRSEDRPWAVADQTVGNSWTIEADGLARRFFFITGCYKSGTHWVQNILNLHPAVNVKGEFHFESVRRGFDEIVGTHWFLAARPRLRPVAEASFEDFVRRMLFVETRDRPAATWLGDRTPRLLTELLPGAPIINIRRDGRDVMVSWNFHHLRATRHDNLEPQMRDAAKRMGPEFQADPTKFNRPGTGFLADEWWFRRHAGIWAGMIKTELGEAPRMRERGTPLLQLIYEDMHRELEPQRRRIFDFLGLDGAQAAEPSHESRTLVGFSHESPTLFYRKGAVGEWKEFFTDQQKRWFKEEAGEALVMAGYEKDLNW